MFTADTQILGNGTRATSIALFDAAGNQITSFGTPPVPTTGTSVIVASPTTTDVVGLPANVSRKRFLIYNNNNQALRVGLGFATSGTVWSFIVAKQGFYDGHLQDFTGDVHISLVSSGTGSILFTELT